MEVIGRIRDVSRDWKSEKLVISFEIDSIPSDLEDLQTCSRPLTVTAKPFRQKRSLNANSYFHVLTGKIAEKLGTSLDHEKNRLIRPLEACGKTGQESCADGIHERVAHI